MNIRQFKIIIFLLILTFSFSLISASSPSKILYIIADGFGPQELGLFLLYTKYIDKKQSSIEKLLNKGSKGLCLTLPYGGLVTDSAAAGTALACGTKTRGGIIGLDPQGQKLENVMEVAKKNNWGTGVISTTRMTHATPAVFSSHIISRKYESDIALQQIESGIDILMSGGRKYFIPKNVKGSRRRDNINVFHKAELAGYKVFNKFEKLKKIKKIPSKILGIYSYDMMPYRIDKDKCKGIPSLSEMVEYSVRSLDKYHSKWIVMAEAGKIDFCGHANDAGTMLKEIYELDDLVKWALEYQKKHRDLLIVLTSDHETGGFSFAYNEYNKGDSIKLKKGYYKPSHNFVSIINLKRIGLQKRSFETIIKSSHTPLELRQNINLYTRMNITNSQAKSILAGDTEKAQLDLKFLSGYSKKSNILSKYTMPYTGIVWATGTHTSTPVIITTLGKKENVFSGVLDNTDVSNKLKNIIKNN